VTFRVLAEWQLQMGVYAEGPDEQAVDLNMLLDHYESGLEHTYHLQDGRWMLVVYRRLPADGRVGLWTDITAIKRAEAERRALEAQLHHSQRLEALGTLAAGAAHEINNALVPVIGLTKLMAGKQAAGSRERRNLDLILAGAERSRDLVKQILAFSRKEGEERPKQSVDDATVLREALRMMRATVQTSIRLVEEIGPSPAITGDPGQLQQVIVNVVTNAAQAIGQLQGSITVTLRPEPDGAHLRLSIADTGCGMDEATLARVFEPFFTTKPVGEGTGLSVVHGIIKAHGGRIEVKSAPAKAAASTSSSRWPRPRRTKQHNGMSDVAGNQIWHSSEL
jgi:signal transduction histidine kinase